MSEVIKMAPIEGEQKEEVVERPYTLRKLKNSDLWTVLGILTKILPDDMRQAFVQVMSGEKSLEEIGMCAAFDMGTMIVENAYKARGQVDAFCADLAGCTVNELNEMEFGTTPLIIYDMVGEAKNTSFFKVLSKLR